MAAPIYGEFRSAHREVVEESFQFTDRLDACTEIGVADEAARRMCLTRAYAGFEEDVRDVRALAQDALDDAGPQCEAALNSYLIVLDRYAAQLQALRESASSLQVDQLAAGSQRLPGEQQRYVRFATNVLRACAPA